MHVFEGLSSQNLWTTQLRSSCQCMRLGLVGYIYNKSPLRNSPSAAGGPCELLSLAMVSSTLLELAPAYWTELLGNASLSLHIIILGTLTTALYFAYSLRTTELHLQGFPVVSLGSDPSSSWSAAGNEILAKGLKEHSGPFQVITGTGPKVCHLNILHRPRNGH
jgi:hypothetical protein